MFNANPGIEHFVISDGECTLRHLRQQVVCLLTRCWRDESGSLQSTEYILMMVMLGIGVIVGLVTVRDQLVQELADAGVALEHVDQSFFIAVPGAGFDPNVPFNYPDPTPGWEIREFDNTAFRATQVPPNPVPTDDPDLAARGITFPAATPK